MSFFKSKIVFNSSCSHCCGSKWILSKYMLINIYHFWPCRQPHKLGNTASLQRMELRLSGDLLKKTWLAPGRTERGNWNPCPLVHQQCTVHDTRYLPHARIHIFLSITTRFQRRGKQFTHIASPLLVQMPGSE